MPDIASLVASIDERLDALNAEINDLQRARLALGTATRAAAPSGARRRSARPTGKGAAAQRSAQPTRTKKAPPRSVASGARQAPRRRPRSNGSRPTKSKAQLFTVERLEHVLSTADAGLAATAIAEQTGAQYQTTLKLLRDLETAGRVRREGARRATRWRLVTDEDRIAERAAQLERQSRKRS
jgi:predicted Rossmann fold nucleotide-binding protein DprA/Smf involved in DNA uptake